MSEVKTEFDVQKRYLSRKWIGFLMGFAAALYLLIVDKIGSGEWVTIMTLLYGMYSAANVWNKK